MLLQQHTKKGGAASEGAISRFARLRRESRPADPDAGADVDAMDRPVNGAWLDRRRLTGLFVCAVALVLAIIAYVTLGLQRALTVDADRLQIASAGRSVLREFIPVSGSVVPARTLYLDAVEGGQVTRVLVEEGQHVTAGQPLLELKNADLQLRLVEAEARLTEQVNDVNMRRLQVEQSHLQFQERLIALAEQIATLERDLARNERLLAEGVVPAKMVEDQRGSLQTLRGVEATVSEAQRVNRGLQTSQTAQMQASVDAISGNLAVARENLQNLVMRAPIAGQLTAFDAEVGEAKARGQRIGQIDGVGKFKLAAFIDEFYLDRVEQGQLATARIGDAEHALVLTKVYPNVRDRLFRIEMAFAQQPPALRRGQTLRAALALGTDADALVVPNGPWLADSGGAWAFVLAHDGRSARRREIRVGRRSPDFVEIVAGVAAGERLIVSPYAQFAGFDRIDIRGNAAPAGRPSQENQS